MSVYTGKQAATPSPTTPTGWPENWTYPGPPWPPGWGPGTPPPPLGWYDIIRFTFGGASLLVSSGTTVATSSWRTLASPLDLERFHRWGAAFLNLDVSGTPHTAEYKSFLDLYLDNASTVSLPGPKLVSSSTASGTPIYRGFTGSPWLGYPYSGDPVTSLRVEFDETDLSGCTKIALISNCAAWDTLYDPCSFDLVFSGETSPLIKAAYVEAIGRWGSPYFGTITNYAATLPSAYRLASVTEFPLELIDDYAEGDPPLYPQVDFSLTGFVAWSDTPTPSTLAVTVTPPEGMSLLGSYAASRLVKARVRLVASIPPVAPGDVCSITLGNVDLYLHRDLHGGAVLTV